jgi:hypothetical protein
METNRRRFIPIVGRKVLGEILLLGAGVIVVGQCFTPFFWTIVTIMSPLSVFDTCPNSPRSSFILLDLRGAFLGVILLLGY